MASGAKERNIGLELLRVVLSFMVVCAHFWSYRENSGRVLYIPLKIHTKFAGCAVPAFMLISFFFMADTLEGGSKSALCKRFRRLFTPYIAWPLIYFAVYIVADALRIMTNMPSIEWIRGLGWQLLLGSSPYLDPVLWFHADMIAITVLFAVLLRVVRHKTNMAIALIAIGAFLLQYSSINYKLFGKLPYEARYTLGRLCEVLPCACAGILIARHGCFKRIQGVSAALVFAAALLFAAKYDVFTQQKAGFGYEGMKFLYNAAGLFTMFYLLPLNRLPLMVKKGILFLSRYSMGVYCLHMLVGRALRQCALCFIVDRTGGGVLSPLCSDIRCLYCRMPPYIATAA